MTTAIGGSTAATTDMTTAAVVDHNRIRFQASRINTRQAPIRGSTTADVGAAARFAASAPRWL